MLRLGVSPPPSARVVTSTASYVVDHGQAIDLRLTPLGREAGLVDDVRWARFEGRQHAINAELDRLRDTPVTQKDNARLLALDAAPVDTKSSLEEVLRRPEI